MVLPNSTKKRTLGLSVSPLSLSSISLLSLSLSPLSLSLFLSLLYFLFLSLFSLLSLPSLSSTFIAVKQQCSGMVINFSSIFTVCHMSLFIVTGTFIINSVRFDFQIELILRLIEKTIESDTNIGFWCSL